MPTAQARVVTDRPGRYLAQLCRHASQMAQHAGYGQSHDRGHAPPEVRRVEWSDTHGIVEFGVGRCTVQAIGSDMLTLRVEASDEESLRRLRQLLTKRIETIGRRDHLSVAWLSPESPEGTDEEDTSPAPETGRRSHRTVALSIVLVKLGIVVLFIALPVGLGVSVLGVHAVIVVALLIAVAVALLVYRRRGGTLHWSLVHRLLDAHRLVAGLRRHRPSPESTSRRFPR
jgi:hypothetical protein